MSRTNDNHRMTAGVYIRLSKEDRHKANKEDDSESITNQRRMLLDYCSANEIDVYDIYNDEDFSGSDRDRPEFNRMIEDARNKRIDLVVCKTQSRFARDMEIVEKYINGLFPLWGVRFIGVVDNTDNANHNTLKQRQINSLVDEWYISDLSANVRATLSSKRKEGLWVGAFAPYGYKKDPANKNHLVIDEEAAEVVRYVFSLYLSGLGVTSIARRLNEEGIPNPATYKQQHNQPFQNAHKECSDIWHTYSIGRMLSNQVYIGNVVQGMSENVSFKSTKKRQKKKSEWDVVENVHEPIISKDIWERTQQLRISKNKSTNRYNSPNLFSNKVKCAKCGGSMRIFYSNHKRYYRCNTKYVAGDRCEGEYISEKVLHRIVLDEIRKLYTKYIDEGAAAKQISIENGLETKLDKLIVLSHNGSKNLRQLDERLEAIYIDKIDGVITSEEFSILKKRFSDEKETLSKKLVQWDSEIQLLNKQLQNRQNRMEIVQHFKNIGELDFNTVQTLIDHVEINGDQHNRIVNIYWNI